MPAITNIPASGRYSGAALRAAVRPLVATHNETRAMKPVEYFGAVAVDFDETPSDNAAAFLDAIDWCADTGGAVRIGGGLYGVDGPILLRSYATFWGCGRRNSWVRQLTVDQTADTFTSTAATDASIYGVEFRDFCIDGGWSPNWGASKSGATGALLRLTGASGGPDDPTAETREGSTNMSDPYHIVTGMRFRNGPASGIILGGRGEMHISFNQIGRMALYGIDCASPDNWFTGNTILTSGESGMRISAGNQRISDCKLWFTGNREDVEGVGAGMEITGAGTKNVICSNISTQDTWGPGLVANGDHLLFTGNIDNPCAGRLDTYNMGWQSSRTKARSFIRLGDLKSGRIIVTYSGGAISDADPYAVDFDNGGADYNQIEIHHEGATIHSGKINAVAGLANNKRWNRVTENMRTIMGRVSTTNLGDAAHSINELYGPDVVELTPNGLAVRDTSGGWRVLSEASTITPA